MTSIPTYLLIPICIFALIGFGVFIFVAVGIIQDFIRKRKYR